MALDWWPQDSWNRTLAEFFGELRRELRSLQPKDSADIVFTKTELGMEATLKRETPPESLEAEDATAGGGGGRPVGIGRLKSLPSVGSGRGTYVALTVNTEGELTETGAAKPIIIPRIYHIN